MERCKGTKADGTQCQRMGTGNCFQHRVTGQCPVCMEDMYSRGSRTLDCQHTFHTRCLDRWKQRARTCPVCRTPFDQPVYRVTVTIECLSNGNRVTDRYETAEIYGLMENLGMTHDMIQRAATSITELIFEIDHGEDALHVLNQLGLRPPSELPS